jgi:hypothetical protein
MGRVHPRKTSRKLLESAVISEVRTIAFEKGYTLAQVEEILRRANGRGKGRPARADRFEILDQSAKAMAEEGKYKHLAPRFHLGPKQLANLVQRNRAYFNRKVRAYSQIANCE